MPIQSDPASVAISGLLTIRSVAQGKEAISASFVDRNDVVLDISSDSDADISGIQLILSALLYARSAGKQLSLSAPVSGAVLDVMERGGFLEKMTFEDRQFWLHDGVRK